MDREALKVLVVDDELPLREELRLFPWEAHRTEWVGEAENGEEAMRLCRSLQPDIVITDITMPVMGGIELFRRLKEEMPRTQVILLTCHTEFAYAQEAVRLGAIQYLVKVTMEERELGEALARAAEAVRQNGLLRLSERSKLRWEASKRLRQLLRGDEPEAKAGDRPAGDAEQELLKLCGASLPAAPLALFAETRPGTRSFVRHELEEALEQAEPRFGFFWQPAGDEVYLLLFQRDFTDMKALRSEAEKLLDSLDGELDRRLPFLSGSIRLFASIGETVRGGAKFAEVCRKLLFGKPLDSFYDGAGRLFPAPSEPVAAEPRAAAAENLLPAARWEEPWELGPERLLPLLRQEFAAWARRRRLPPEQLRALAAERLRGWLRNNGPQPPDWPLAAAVAEASSLGELVAALIHAVESARGDRACRREIADAKAYIAANLAAPLTLAAVSAQVGLSPHYLSRLFREETGFSFNDFVTDKRIERAIRLLKTTSLRVYEVAEEVGIPSYRYFAVLFRERTGAAPSEFKKAQPARETEEQP
ncbi:response regulator [Cohnella zeiphila]|uniref:Response regulator n=1 Tax=Cohnella zeiphila TaxID=2761120 RepID=A0A7X0SSA3_9BACL|nr:response regulator [Cohnella zeiphila]MBB6732948.1 response regulator [Cohnella zeiphila]